MCLLLGGMSNGSVQCLMISTVTKFAAVRHEPIPRPTAADAFTRAVDFTLPTTHMDSKLTDYCRRSG